VIESVCHRGRNVSVRVYVKEKKSKWEGGREVEREKEIDG